jgi:hypothetical protein
MRTSNSRTEDTRMSGNPIDHQAAHARLALLIQLKQARTSKLSHVTGCLADPAFLATAAPGDITMLRSHQAALEEIIGLVERQRAEAQALVDTLERAQPPSPTRARGLQRLLAWRWGS